MNTADGTRYALVYRGSAKLPTASLPVPAPAGSDVSAGTSRRR